MISATQKVSGWSLVASSGKKGGCSGRIPRISPSSRSQLVPSVAETGMSSRNACAPRHASRTGSIRSRGRTRSALLSTQKTGPRYASSGSRTSRSGWARCAASTTRQTRSTSSTARRAVACMKLSSPAGRGGPVPSVGGLRRGATRLRSASGCSFQEPGPESRGYPSTVRREDLPLPRVHEPGLAGVPVVVTDEVEHAVRDEQVELERERHAEPARLAPSSVRGDYDLAHERARRIGDAEREGEHIGAPPHAAPGGVQPADLVIADDENPDVAPRAAHRRERRARGSRQTRRRDRDTPLTIRDRDRHQAPSAAFPLSRARAPWASYARTIAETSRWRTTSPSSK